MQEDIDIQRFREDLEEMKEKNVDSNNFEEFKIKIENRLSNIMAFRKELAKNVQENKSKAEEMLKEAEKYDWDKENPYYKANELIISANNDLILNLIWSDHQFDLFRIEREKLYNLILALVKQELNVKLVEKDKNRAIEITEKMLSFFKEELKNLREQQKSVMESLLAEYRRDWNNFKAEIYSEIQKIKNSQNSKPEELPVNNSFRLPQMPEIQPKTQEEEKQENQEQETHSEELTPDEQTVLEGIREGLSLKSISMMNQKNKNLRYNISEVARNLLERGLIRKEGKRYVEAK
jgi:hypothetical protein